MGTRTNELTTDFGLDKPTSKCTKHSENLSFSSLLSLLVKQAIFKLSAHILGISAHLTGHFLFEWVVASGYTHMDRHTYTESTCICTSHILMDRHLVMLLRLSKSKAFAFAKQIDAHKINNNQINNN